MQFEASITSYLHGQTFELGVPSDRLYVPHRQTYEQVHEQDGHQDHEDAQHDEGGQREGQVLVALQTATGTGVIALSGGEVGVVLTEVGLHVGSYEVDLSQHHGERAQERHRDRFEREMVALQEQ